MRRALIALLLIAPALAGCITADTVDPSAGGADAPPALTLSEVPEGATVEAIPGGVRLLWTDVALPFTRPVPVPAGATIVEARAALAGDGSIHAVMSHGASGWARCQPTYVTAWNLGAPSEATCTALTAVDPLPTEWSLRVWGGDVAETVEVRYTAEALDGIAGQLDLGQLSMPTHDALDTEILEVESWDGTRLHVEVTRPDTEAPVPAVIVSSPYNHLARAFGARPYDALIKDWVPRGYAVVVADVRGFGESGGCVEVWGPNEQRDQAFLVNWTAEQPWSSGSVGFMGVSYVGTTPVEAAVQAPPALKAIVPVAGVINAYDDWHYGGAPNMEPAGSPVAYQAIGTLAQVRPTDPLTTALNHGNGLCDATLVARANDPRAIYDDFYRARNFSARAGNVEAAVLFQQGFEDGNVKSAMANHWFNALTAPKLALVGHWDHQYAVRADTVTLTLAWMDQYVRGRPVGFEGVANVSLTTNAGTHRLLDAWPPASAAEATLWPHLASGALGAEPTEGDATIVLDGAGAEDWTAWSGAEAPADTRVVLERALEAPLELAGVAHVRLAASLAAGGNAHVYAELHDVAPDGSHALVTYGAANLAHRDGHRDYQPLAPGEAVMATLPFLPTDHVFEAGHTLRVVLKGATANDGVTPGQPGRLTIHGGADGTALRLPTLPPGTAEATPRTIQP